MKVTVCDFDAPLLMNLFPKLLNVVRKTTIFQTAKMLRLKNTEQSEHTYSYEYCQ